MGIRENFLAIDIYYSRIIINKTFNLEKLINKKLYGKINE